MKIYSEDKLQQDCFVWFSNTYCLKNHNPRGLIFSIPNGSSRDIREAVKLKATGLTKGASDLIVIAPNGKLMFIELKTDKGVQSEYQKEFEKRVTALGYEYHLIRSLEDFKMLIENSK
jgi:hypothetical protein